MEKACDQLVSELQQLESYNHYLANECRRQDTCIDRQTNSLKKREGGNKGHGEMTVRDLKHRHYESACYGIRNLIAEKLCFIIPDQETLPQNGPVGAP